MGNRDSLAGGDRLARGARSAKFIAGGAKKDDKVQINKGIVMSDADRKALDSMPKAAEIVREKPVMKRRPRPLYDRVVVRPKNVEEVSAGGIILQTEDSEKEQPREGTVLFVGKGKIDAAGNQRPLEVKPGDTVLFGKYAGTLVEIDGEQVLMFREEEIFAVIE